MSAPSYNSLGKYVPKTNGTSGSTAAPDAAGLLTAEIATNSFLGDGFIKKEDGTVALLGGNARAIQGKAMSSVAPVGGQAIVFNAAANQYEPGSVVSPGSSAPALTQFTGNGSTTLFAINGFTNSTPTNYLVVVGGVIQRPDSGTYTVSAAGLQFSSPPANGVSGYVLAYQIPSSASSAAAQAVVAIAGQTVFTLTAFSYLPGTSTLQVFRNGLRLTAATDYTETSTTSITLTTPASAGDEFVFQGGAVVSGTATPGSSVSFLQGGTGAVPRTIQDKARETVSVKDFGAVGDGVTDDTAAIQAAVTAAGVAGGIEVYLPPTGSPYKITGTIIIPNGVCLIGVKGKNFEGATASNAQWAEKGSWLNPTNSSNPAIRLQGHGSGIVGVNFIHNQPAPSGGAWTPITYGYCIEQISSHSRIKDILIVNASHGIHLNYTSASGGGTDVFWENIIVSAFIVRIKTSNVNDTICLSNIHCRNLWYSSNSFVVAYIRANTKGWYCQYTDNPIVNGLEFFEDAIAIYFEDGTCLGNTHSLYNGTLTNVQFNLPQVCMKIASGNTTVVANFANCISQTGNAFGYTYADTAFQLATSNAFIKFTGLTVVDAGGQVFDLGTSSGGIFIFDNLDVNQYSTSASGQVCFSVAAGAKLRLSGYRIVKTNLVNGLKFAGAGLDYISTNSAGTLLFFGRFTEQNIVTTTSYQAFSANSLFRPGQSNAHQIRLEGELLVNTAQPASAMSIKLGGGISGVEKTGISSDTTGWKTFDTGWIDISQSDIDGIVTLGQIQIKSTVSGVNVSSGSIQVNFR